MITLAETKQFLGITSNTNDALIQQMISSAEATIETRLGYKLSYEEGIKERLLIEWSGLDTRPEVGVFVRTYPPQCILKRCPVVLVTSITCDGIEMDASSYKLDGNIVMFYNNFDTTRREIIATYNAGWTAETLPADLKMAILSGVKMFYQSAGTEGTGAGMVRQKKIGDFSVAYESGAVTPSSWLLGYKEILDRYIIIA